MTQPTQGAGAPHSVSLFDARPFFEKALVFGVQHGIIDSEKLESIRTDAPKGMVQIARYFGNENLRPELEKARDRIVNLVSLYLESTTGGDLHQAAESLRDHSFLSRSKGGSDMLKAMIAMPQNSHFGMNERGAFSDEQIPTLAKWSLRSLPDYQTELAKRQAVASVMDAAIWMADALGMDVDALEDAGKDAEAVIRTALLVIAAKRTEMPDWVAFEKLVVGLRSKSSKSNTVPLPKNVPEHIKPTVEAVRQSVLADLPKILDATVAVRKLFNQTPAFMGRYFWDEDALSEVDDYDRSASQAWTKITGGHSDDSSLLTLFLCVAASSPPKTLLTEKAASALVRKIRKTQFQPELALQYIAEHAPVQHQDDYVRMWQDFCEEARSTLLSSFDYALTDALSLITRECNVTKQG
jgi:hypothetical protein